MGIPQQYDRDDLHVYKPTALDKMGEHRAAVEAAIQARESAILAGIAQQQQQQLKARHAAGANARCREIEQRIFRQVAVGGIFNGK